VTLYFEQDGRRIPLDLSQLEQRGGFATSPLATLAALAGGATTFAAAVAFSSGYLETVSSNWRNGLDVGVDAFRLWWPIAQAIGFGGYPLLKLAHHYLDVRDSKEHVVAKVADLPTPRPGRGTAGPPEGLHEKQQRAFRRLRAQRPRNRATMQQSTAPVRATVVEDWRPQFCRVTTAMLGKPITRAAFGETWRNNWQGLYYRYVGDSTGPYGMRHGMWRHGGFIEQVSANGKCEWVEGLTWTDILNTHRPLKSWAVTHGYSPAQVG